MHTLTPIATKVSKDVLKKTLDEPSNVADEPLKAKKQYSVMHYSTYLSRLATKPLKYNLSIYAYRFYPNENTVFIMHNLNYINYILYVQ